MAIQVQAILFASLCASLFSALLAMLGKQWLNRCAPVDMRGTMVERGQHRQRKIDGIANWYFDHVMESLPLMLQAALLLLGCALSRFLWDINTTVASVVIAVTASGLLFYLFIVIVGAVSANCPYQTPGASFLRHILDRVPHILLRIQDTLCNAPNIIYLPEDLLRFIGDMLHRILHRVPDILRHLTHTPNTLRSVFSAVVEESAVCIVLRSVHYAARYWQHYGHDLLYPGLIHIALLPVWLILDVCRAVIGLLISATHRAERAQLEPQTEQQVAVRPLELGCIAWALQTSVDEPVRLSAVEYLETMVPHDFDPIQAAASWFDILITSVRVTDGRATIAQGLEQLAATSSLFCLHTLSHIAAMDTPNILDSVCQRYTRTFPSWTNFDGLPFSHTLGVIHRVFHLINSEGLRAPTRPRTQRPVLQRVEWNGFEPSKDVYITVACALAKLAWFEYQRSGQVKVPRLFLRFALHSLSQDPQPPPSVIADCLTIIAIDLKCDVSNVVAVGRPGQGCVCINQVTIALT